MMLKLIRPEFAEKIFSIEEVESYDDLGNRIKKARNYIV